MKNIIKAILLTSMIIFLLSGILNVSSTKYNDELQIYPITEQKIIINVIAFYKNNNKTVFKIVDTKNRIQEDLEEVNDIEAESIENYEDVGSSNNYVEEVVYEEEANFDSSYTGVAEYGLQFVGNPYVYGGSSLTDGTDCSGFVMLLYEHFGVSLPRTASAQSKVGYKVTLENAQPGDIISYGYNGIVSHSAIYLGNERIVHASTPQDGITTASVYMMPIITIRRIG